MVVNDLLMQFQADVLGVPVIRPTVAETTALGAAYAAGLAVGFWAEVEDLRENWGKDKEWEPKMDAADATRSTAWKKAVTRTFDWVGASSRPSTRARATRGRWSRGARLRAGADARSKGEDRPPSAHLPEQGESP